jgi:hypothetical protein
MCGCFIADIDHMRLAVSVKMGEGIKRRINLIIAHKMAPTWEELVL